MKLIYTFLIFILYVSCATTSSNNTTNIEKSWIDLGSISYGIDSNQYIEITVPEKNNQSINVIFYIHGYGNKMVDLTFLEKYRNNYIIGKLDYRHVTPKRPELNIDELLLDVHNGLNILKEITEAENIEINKVIIIGNSLGATLALLYTYTFFDKSPIPIAFCVSMSGLTDMTDAMIIKHTERFGKNFIQKYILSIGSILTKNELYFNDITKFGFSETAIEKLKNISPIYYVNENTSPTIIIHNINDKIIPFSNAISLNHVLNVNNVPHIFIQSITDYGHELGPNVRNKNDLVFAPINARYPVNTPKRYTRKIYQILEDKIIESINNFIDLYCL